MKNNKIITIYISDHCEKCAALLSQMNRWELNYRTKNISRNSEYREELQEEGIFGTPATFIEGQYKPVLGFQKNEISYILGLDFGGISNSYFSE